MIIMSQSRVVVQAGPRWLASAIKAKRAFWAQSYTIKSRTNSLKMLGKYQMVGRGLVLIRIESSFSCCFVAVLWISTAV